MQCYQIKDEAYSDSLKSVTVNDYPQDSMQHSSFVNGLQNARKILHDLQESLNVTRNYEKQLMRCRSSHAHKPREWWDSEQENHQKCSDSDTEMFGNVVFAESWSAMSIVCLQYKYEELSKRYKFLLEMNEERCKAVGAKDAQLLQLQKLAESTHAQLLEAHKTLLAVGEKYMAMRQRKRAQKYWYAKRVKQLKSTVEDLLVAADQAWETLDARLARVMRSERQGGAALLLAEVRRVMRTVEDLLVAADQAWETLDARLARVMRSERQGGAALLLAEVRRVMRTVEDLLVAADQAWETLDARLARVMRSERQGGAALLLAEVRRVMRTVEDLLVAADQAWETLDARLARVMRSERQGGAAALLLAEIRKCNHLCLENLRLKAQIQELAPWEH